MPEYKPNQCPECGCEEFVAIQRFLCTYIFEEHGFDDHMESPEYIEQLPEMECKACVVKINESESEKQGKIILA